MATGPVAMMVACGRGDSRDDHTPPRTRDTSATAPSALTLAVPASRAGFLRLADGELWFIDCTSLGQRIALQDMPNGDGMTVTRTLGGGNKDVLALVQLQGNRLLDLRYAAPEHRGCTDFPPAGVVEARGNEPFWAVQVYGDSARVRVPLNPAGFRFTNGRWRRPAAGEWVYEARRAESGVAEFLLLRLFETRCSDGMSDTRYPFRAELVRDGNPARGCAVEGRAALRR